MKRASTTFIQLAVVLLGIRVLAALLGNPGGHERKRHAVGDLFQGSYQTKIFVLIGIRIRIRIRVTRANPRQKREPGRNLDSNPNQNPKWDLLHSGAIDACAPGFL